MLSHCALKSKHHFQNVGEIEGFLRDSFTQLSTSQNKRGKALAPLKFFSRDSTSLLSLPFNPTSGRLKGNQS